VLPPCPTSAPRFVEDRETWFVPPTMPPAERLRVLDGLATEAARDPSVQKLSGCIAALAASRWMGGGPPPDAFVVQTYLDVLHELVDYVPDPSDAQGNPLEQYQTVRWTLFSRRGALSSLTGHPRGAGDCEDLATAFVALLRARGLHAGLQWLSQPGLPQNHVAAVVCGLHHLAFDADGCVWAETSIPGARLGEDPYAVVRRVGRGDAVFGTPSPAGAPP